jgi:DNA mismatch repair protein MLH1
MSYEDGKPKPLKPGEPAKPKPIAGTYGTVICAEDLFYNNPTRRKTITNLNDQYKIIQDVIKKYAINNPGIALSLKKVVNTLKYSQRM